MQFEQAARFLELIGVVALAPFERAVSEYVELLEDTRTPCGVHAMLHHGAVDAVADGPVAVFRFHPYWNAGKCPSLYIGPPFLPPADSAQHGQADYPAHAHPRRTP